MLAEIAFTPAIFDDTLQSNAEEWSEQIRELGAAMFPKTAACPVVVSNLYHGSWQHEAAEIIKAIANPNDRVRCQSLLDKIDRAFVSRPSKLEWPTNEDGWGKVAIASHADVPMDRIVFTDSCHGRLIGECEEIRSLGEVTDAGFWHGVPRDGSPRFDIAYQVGLLRALTMHSQFLWFASPHVRGTNDDETDFAIALIRKAFDRPTSFSKVVVEVHAEAPDRPNNADFASRLSKLQGNLATRLREALRSGESVQVVMWPKLLDRVVIGGTHSALSGGGKATSPRWGVYLGHVARRVDPPSIPPTGWHILMPNAIRRWHDLLSSANRISCVPPFTVDG